MKKLPIGIQTFREIREENYCYVDKTDIAYTLIDNGKYYFLSRPRRFGKSLFLDTLSEIFKGSKELFEDLAIYDTWNWEEKYPVIKIDFGKGSNSSPESIVKNIKSKILLNAKNNTISINEENDLSNMFAELIENVYQKYNQKVVILIDEYDKPIIDNIIDKELGLKARDILASFYSAIKSSDEYLKFVFMTGVSKFSKMNLFSSLNNITDITIQKKYATIAGYTHNDLIEVFKEHLNNVDLDKVKKWYNGYNYFGEPIYNPFDILQFIDNECQFKNYWWESGNPSFLIKKLRENPVYFPDLESVVVGSETLNAFDVDYIDIVALLWQTGYLTFDKSIIDDLTFNETYQMKIPNLEIQLSLNALFMDYLTNIGIEKATLRNNFSRALRDFDAQRIEQILKSLFAAIPNDNYRRNDIAKYEGYYSAVIFTFLKSVGFDIITEDTTNKGRIDLTITLPRDIVIVEFKVDSNESPIEQIKERKYYEKYMNDEKSIYLMGVSFSSEERNVVGFEWEKWK